MITVSIVSHGHSALVSQLLNDLSRCSEVDRVLITYNIPEDPAEVPASLAARTTILSNGAPKGFGANHNAAFVHCQTPYFCVINPDVRIPSDPFPQLLAGAEPDVGLVAPLVIDQNGRVEDSARRFPTPWRLFLKVAGIHDGSYAQTINASAIVPDWVAGMFMLFRASDFAALDGFDDGYFLYYEDVDLCTRLWRSGRSIRVVPAVKIIHDARRSSHKSAKYLRWHLASMLRYMTKHLGRLPEIAR